MDDRLTDDEDQRRWIVVDGRRWRRSDPSIPEALRQELVHELMDARRAVDRPRVQDAKVALGERGRAWWEPADDEALRTRSAAAIRALLHRRAGRTICPSDVARVVGGDGWRSAMPLVREVAAVLADDGEVVVTQRGRPVDVRTARGPLRIGLAAADPVRSNARP